MEALVHPLGRSGHGLNFGKEGFGFVIQMIDRIHREHGWEATVLDGIGNLTEDSDSFFDILLVSEFPEGFGGDDPDVGRGILQGLGQGILAVLNPGFFLHEQAKGSPVADGGVLIFE